jgi:tetratricopeptide (TPR) repeat protein
MLECADAARRSADAEAETACSKAMEAADDLAAFDRTSDVRPMRLYAEALAAQGRHEEAVASFDRVVARLRQVPVFALDRTLGLRGLARSLMALDRNDDALRAYGQAERQLSEALRGAERNTPFRAEILDYLRSVLPEYADLLDRLRLEGEARQARARLEALR